MQAVNVVTFYYLDRFIKSVSCMLPHCTVLKFAEPFNNSVLDLPPEARLGCFPGKADGLALAVICITLLVSLTSELLKDR